MEDFKKIAIFLQLFVLVVGVFGTFGFIIYYEVPFAIIVGYIITVLYAIPQAVKYWKKLIE